VCFGCVQAADRTLAFALHQRNLPALERIFWERTNPSHPDYAKWMSLEEIAAITGATDDTLDFIKRELARLGGDNVRVAPSREYVLAEFPNRVANSILMSFGHPHASRKAVLDNNRYGLAMPSLSYATAFRTHVAYVIESTETLKTEMRASVLSERYSKRFKSMDGELRTNSLFSDPASQKKSYLMPTDLKSRFSNNSQAVWGPGTFGVSNSDLSSFYSFWNIPATTASVKVPWYAGQPGGDNFGEGTLDTTYITSMALGVTTYVINSNTTMDTEEGPGFGYALENFMLLSMAQAPQVPYVLSMSLGSLSWDSCNQMCILGAAQGSFSFASCMQYVQYTQRQVCMMDTAPQTERISTEFMKLGLRGVTLLAATGDGGSHYSFQPFPNDQIGSVLNQVSCQYNFPTFPAASPFVLGVGGTQWSGAPSPSQPIAWSASGSGFSWRFPRPAYQEAAVSAYLKQYANSPGFPGFQYFNSTNRAYPDVAAVADNVPMWLTGAPTITGGTSASAPTMAGILSMINDARLSSGKPSLGFVNPALYQLAQQRPGILFYDVTQGNSACASDGSCCNTGFPAATGWDPVTGLGSPIWTGLLKYLG
jgi:tripeptidyl-peptidase-1